MQNFAEIGLALFLVGLIPWTIGGFISFRTDYPVHNKHIRSSFDPSGESVRVGRNELWWAFFRNPKSRWWCAIGFSLCAAGMLLIIFAMLTPRN
jgi:hypothetical protein